MYTILATCGYLPETMRELRRHWNVVDVVDQNEALDWLRTCKELPSAVVMGYVTPHIGQRGSSISNDGQMSADVLLPAIHQIDPDLPVIISAMYAPSKKESTRMPTR